MWHRREGYWEAMYLFREELKRSSTVSDIEIDDTEINDTEINDTEISAVGLRRDPRLRAECGRIRQTSSCLLCRQRDECHFNQS